MSRIGKKPVQLKEKVEVSLGDGFLCVKGPRGQLKQALRPEVSFEIGKGEVVVSRRNDSRTARAMHGLYRSLLANMVEGVSSGFRRVLLINGVGYRAEARGSTVGLNLGYSNPIEYGVPDGISITTEGNNKVVIEGIDKQLVSHVASEIRSLRPPEPYKGKGVKYEEEVIRRKVGKTGVK